MVRRPRLQSRRARLVAGALVVVVVWLGVVAWMVIDARHALQDGQRELARTRDGATASRLLDPATDRDLAAAERSIARARSRFRSPLLAPLRVVPVVGRHLRAADRVTSAAGETTTIARRGVADLRTLSKRPVGAGPGRIALLEDLTAVIDRTRRDLDGVDPGSSRALVGPLADAVDRVRRERDDAVTGLDHAADATRAVTRMLSGPDDYLLLGANNAEMRAGAGMFLSAAPLQFDRGTLRMGEVRPTAELIAPNGGVPVTGDLERNWWWARPGEDARQLGLSADFPQSAEVARRWWGTLPGGGPVAGVIVVDVDAIRELLRVVGPVEVDGVRYDADTIRGELLREQYRRAGDGKDAIGERRDQLGDVAQAVFARIEAGDWKLDRLATALVDLVQRRHLLVWSADRDSQQAWETSGASGALTDRSLSVALLNRGAEKLDPYLATTAVITTDGGDQPRVDLTYTVTSSAPATGPRYQIGPNLPGLAPGQHRGIVTVNLPAGAYDVTVDGARRVLDGTDGPTVVVAGEVTVARGQTVTVRVSARLPVGTDRLRIEPSARLPRTDWTIDGRHYELDRRRTVPVGP